MFTVALAGEFWGVLEKVFRRAVQSFDACSFVVYFFLSQKEKQGVRGYAHKLFSQSAFSTLQTQEKE